MNKKRICQHLNKVVKEWIDSVKDTKLQEMLTGNVIITGGAITSLLLNDKPHDYDIYFRTKEVTKKVAEYYVALYKNTNSKISTDIEIIDEEELEGHNNVGLIHPGQIKILIRSDGIMKEDKGHKEKYRPKFLSANAITLSDRIQLIVRFYGEPEEIHTNYDFVHCMNYWVSWDPSKLDLSAESLESILNKRLVYRGSKYPICSILRTRKFIKRGWTINAGQMFKMCFQVANMDLTDVNVLEDQLTGVDTMYFQSFITTVKNELSQYPGRTIDESYVGKVIDMLFE